jgi:hypothetical protein
MRFWLSVGIGLLALCGACARDSARSQVGVGGSLGASAAGQLAPAGSAATPAVSSAGSAADGGGRGALGAAGGAGGSLAGRGGSSGAGASGVAGASGAGGGQAGVSGAAVGGQAGSAGLAGSGGAAGHAGSAGHAGGAGAAAGSGGTSSLLPVYRVPLRIHMALSKLSNADLGPVLSELNQIWLQQAGICFEIEVTDDETNRSDGFDFRYTAGQIPGAASANGLTENAHSIWSIDHPNLGTAPHPVQNPTARTTAHELGHALGLAHENPPPSNDCSSPCYCVTLGDNCDDFLLRSGTKGYFLSAPEVDITRKRAAQRTLMDSTPLHCAEPVFMR